jgi:HK97 gp10 family phage protein
MPARVRREWNGDAIKGNIHAGGNIALNRVGENSVEMSQTIVPEDSGRLKKSIAHDIFEFGRGWILLFGSLGDEDGPVEYAFYVEIGTTKMRAQPYIRPVVDIVFESIGDELKRAIAA